MSKYDLSILIPARNEEFLGLTVQNIIENTSDRTEVICVLDGDWIDGVPQHERVTVVYLQKSIGQRAATNLAANISSSKYLAKTDAHCSFSSGFDEVLMSDMQDNWVVVPTMKNLHAFDWVCEDGHRRYQSPSGPCITCGKPTVKDILFRPRDKTPNSRSYCFDSEPHFQYNNDWTKRAEFQEQGDLTDTMSLQGSFFMVTRKRYWDLNLSEEQFGSWGSQGLEVAIKNWTSGGRTVVNNKCWYAHLFRTQGGDFSFPYPQQHSKVLEGRKYARKQFYDNHWRKMVYPLSNLLEKFWPIKGWTEAEYIAQKQRELKTKRSGILSIENLVTGSFHLLRAESIRDTGLETERLLRENRYPHEFQEEWNSFKETDFRWHVERFCRSQQLDTYLEEYRNKKLFHPKINYTPVPTKGILYYTDGELDTEISSTVRAQLLKSGLPVTSVSLKPIDFGDTRIVLPLERGILTMAKQILAGLEAMTQDIVYLNEHDVLYSKSHYDFIPPKKDAYYYNINVWKLNTDKGYGLKVDDCRQLSGLCAYRETLINHYRERVLRIERDGWSNRIGHEPGTHNRPERIDDIRSETWASQDPIVDIRHGRNLTRTKWKPEDFRNKKYTIGWTESKIIPFWGSAEVIVSDLR